MDKNEKTVLLGITFEHRNGRVSIYKATLEAIGYPEYYRFRIDVEKRYFAIESCEMNTPGSHRFMGFSRGYCQKSLGLIEQIYDLCDWNYDKSYTSYGIPLYDGEMVGFELKKAEETKGL